MVHATFHPTDTKIGTLQRMSSRCSQQNPPRQGGLHIKLGHLQQSYKDFQKLDTPRLGYFCKSREFQIQQVHSQIPPLGGYKDKCSNLQSRRHNLLLCQTPLDLHRCMAPQTVDPPPHNLFDDNPPVGFSILVAPLSQAQSKRGPSGTSTPLPRTFSKLRGRGHAPHPLAPSLYTIIRGKLEEQQISPEGVKAYLDQLPKLDRYQNAFQIFWEQCVGLGDNFSKAPLWEIATQLVRLNAVNKNQARNAYSALLLIPGWDQIRFSPLLKACKRTWNQSVPKYPAFWSASPVVKALTKQPLTWSSIPQVRDRLILSWRVFQLARSIDLSRLFRKISFLGEKPFVWIQRKGWLTPRWEEVVYLPNLPALCPWQLLQAYVKLTHLHCAEETEVLRTLHAPF